MWVAGATDPQHSSTASEALKGALHEGRILQRLANVAKYHAAPLANPTNRSATRSHAQCTSPSLFCMGCSWLRHIMFADGISESLKDVL